MLPFLLRLYSVVSAISFSSVMRRLRWRALLFPEPGPLPYPLTGCFLKNPSFVMLTFPWAGSTGTGRASRPSRFDDRQWKLFQDEGRGSYVLRGFDAKQNQRRPGQSTTSVSRPLKNEGTMYMLSCSSAEGTELSVLAATLPVSSLCVVDVS